MYMVSVTNSKHEHLEKAKFNTRMAPCMHSKRGKYPKSMHVCLHTPQVL